MNLRNCEQYDQNPFIKETVDHIEKGDKFIQMGKDSSQMMIDTDTGEALGHNVFVKKIEVDKAQFRKLFISSMADIFDLPRAAQKVLSHFMKEQRPNKDTVIFDLDECFKTTGYNSKATIFKAISILIEKKFIARSKKTYKYFINPTMFFNGDRLTLVKQFILKQDPAEQDPAEQDPAEQDQ